MIRVLNLRWLHLSACILLLTACGTESNMGDVTGTVSVDGQPAERGSVSFAPLSGAGSTSGAEISNGKYSAKVSLGKNKVEIRVPKVVGKQRLYDTPDSPVQELLEEVLPAKYNDQTVLELDVKRGKNEKNWELTEK